MQVGLGTNQLLYCVAVGKCPTVSYGMFSMRACPTQSISKVPQLLPSSACLRVVELSAQSVLKGEVEWWPRAGIPQVVQHGVLKRCVTTLIQ
jgi:hypothetical protein